MWWTPRGERVLRGAEWDLFREGLDGIWGLVEQSMDDPELFSSGVEAFDRLQPNQKLALLALVGNALKDEAEPRPELTAHTEATVAAIFHHIVDQVVLEIEMVAELGVYEEATLWRQLVLAAYREAEEGDGIEEQIESRSRGDSLRGFPSTDGDREDADNDELWVPPSVGSDHVDDWEFLIDCLANRILWEGDYEMSGVFLDADPTESGMQMDLMGIAEDYYTAIAPDPTDQQLELIRRRLRWLCGRPESH
jgi:hypothetical protein